MEPVEFLYTHVAADGWWNAEGEGEVVGEVRRHVGGERSLRRFLSLRVESSQERAAVYSGDDIVSPSLKCSYWAYRHKSFPFEADCSIPRLYPQLPCNYVWAYLCSNQYFLEHVRLYWHKSFPQPSEESLTTLMTSYTGIGISHRLFTIRFRCTAAAVKTRGACMWQFSTRQLWVLVLC